MRLTSLRQADLLGIKLPDDVKQQLTRRKYNNSKPIIDGIKFDSQREADEYSRLKIEKQAKLIADFDRQVTFVLWPGFAYGKRQIRPIKYIADFVVNELDGSQTVRETKGMRTQAYLLKKKLFLKQYPGIKFVEC